MPDHTPDQLREHAAEIMLDHARDVEFLSVAEHLADQEIDDPNDDLAREIHDLIHTADITISWPDDSTAAEQIAPAGDETEARGSVCSGFGCDLADGVGIAVHTWDCDDWHAGDSTEVATGDL